MLLHGQRVELDNGNDDDNDVSEGWTWPSQVSPLCSPKRSAHCTNTITSSCAQQTGVHTNTDTQTHKHTDRKQNTVTHRHTQIYYIHPNDKVTSHNIWSDKLKISWSQVSLPALTFVSQFLWFSTADGFALELRAAKTPDFKVETSACILRPVLIKMIMMVMVMTMMMVVMMMVVVMRKHEISRLTWFFASLAPKK